LVGIGNGATFINKYLTGYMNFVSGLAIIGGEPGETPKASVPAYVAGESADAYIAANNAQGIGGGRYVNNDSRFEYVFTADAPASAAEGLKDAWDKVLCLYGRIGNYIEAEHVVATWYTRPFLTGDTAADQARKYQYFDSLEAVEGYERFVNTEDLNDSGTLSLWYEYIPDCVKDAAPGTVPVIFLMHGNTNDPRTQVDTAAWANIAVRDGVILVAPEWQGHVYQGYAYEPMSARRSEEGEETYVISVLEKVLEKYPQADARRVYMSGLSAGSRQTTTYGTENPKYFAAGGGHSGPTAGNMETVEKYKDTYDFPVIYFTGDCDEYQGNTFDVDNLDTNAIKCLNAFRVLNNMPALTNDDYTAENARIYGVPWDEVYTIEPTAENIPTIIGGVMANEKGVEISFNRILGWGHWNYCPDTEYMWNFMKRYARDLETGETIILEETAYNGWKTEDGKDYWYENGVKQGTRDDDQDVKDADGNPRGREIYDPASDAWYWLDAEFDGAKAVDKEVWMPYVINGEEPGSTNGKWVRYDAEGRMIKGFKRVEDRLYYYDPITGAGADNEFVKSGNDYSYVYYWYEKGERQGTKIDPQNVIGDGTPRGREIYDPATDAWYWLEANDLGRAAKNKQVWIPYIFRDEEPGSTEGKWVRYDAEGRMVKGWYRNEDGIYYYDLITGAMVKGTVEIDGRKYTFDEVTGIAQGNIDVRVELDDALTANVTGGRIVGFVDENGVKTFLGIPFGANTEGENRFRDPQPVVPWAGEKDCTEFGSISIEALQDPFMCWSKEYVDWDLTYDNGRCNEDILNLNVWTKAEKGDKKPVIVYIHGGGNTSGSGQNEVYSGKNIVEKDVVYVTINYRYGILGFLYYVDAGGEEITGNFAIKDMVQALQWVKDNIAEFGGDPENVTIAGQSAGSRNVQQLIKCPAAAGLFQRAVAMSANAYTSSDLTKEAANAAATAALGNYSVADLRAMSTGEIDNIRANVYNPSNYVIDGEYSVGSLKEAYDSGEMNKVDLMHGWTSGDAVLFGSFLTVSENTPEAYTEAVKAKLGENADEFLAAYPADDNIKRLVTKINCHSSGYGLAVALIAKSTSDPDHKNFQYCFTREVPDQDPAVKAQWGAFHTGDVGYWLNIFSNTTNRPWEDVDYELGELMCTYITNFAKTGDPNGAGLPEWKDTASNSGYGAMHLCEESAFEEMTDAQLAFWKGFYK
ncbi:MAG: carboxylesterase family protein, partial [Solobacterium sp.]|nr:carboxylesterase family protein [Solobacterium sp.]